MQRKPEALLGGHKEEQKTQDLNWGSLRASQDVEAGAPAYQSMEIENDPTVQSPQPQQTPVDPADDLEDVRPVILGPAFLFEEAAHHEQVRAQYEKAKKFPSLVVDQKTLQRYGGKEALTPIDIERLAEDRPKRPVVKVWLTALLLLAGGIGFTATAIRLIRQGSKGGPAFAVIGFLLLVPGVYSSCAIVAGWRGWRGYLDLQERG